jgi:lipoprotein-anchoring transpeptidase ErfK/SrfK
MRNLGPAVRSWLIALLLIPAMLLATSACGRQDSGPKVLAGKGTPYSDLLVPNLTASVQNEAVGVAVDQPVTLNVQGGVLGSVSMVDDKGEELPGTIAPDGLSWVSADRLGYNKKYTVTAQTLGLGGVVTESMSFESHSPANLTMPYLSPGDGAYVGVGQPIAVRFDENIPDRRVAQDAITVTTNPPVEGAFYWLSNREVRWRPQSYWPPGTTFTIGDEVIATADDATKQLTVRRNGQVIKTMPISMGKNKTPTPNGTYTIGDRHARLVMDSSTYGVPTNSPEGYRLEVDWATQMSYSGIYVHSAPWSVGSQGSENVSHGCLNASPENAQWFFNNTKRGDVVVVRGTVGSVLSGAEGLGDWNIPWSQWKAGNANT